MCSAILKLQKQIDGLRINLKSVTDEVQGVGVGVRGRLERLEKWKEAEKETRFWFDMAHEESRKLILELMAVRENTSESRKIKSLEAYLGITERTTAGTPEKTEYVKVGKTRIRK
jgi:hypothetical protein